MKNDSSRFALLRGLLFWLGVLLACLGVYAGLGYILYFLIGLVGVCRPSYLLCVVVGMLFAVVMTCAFLGHELLVAPVMVDPGKRAE